MQAMLMCCIDEIRWLALTEGEREEVMKDYGAWVADLERSGQHRATEKLASDASGRCALARLLLRARKKRAAAWTCRAPICSRLGRTPSIHS